MITALRLEGVAVERGGRRLFDQLSFRLGSGEAAALTGPNGAGKTSLLRTIAALAFEADLAGGGRWTS